MNTIVEVKVPDIGDFDSVEVIEILVAEGDMINIEDSLITVESDKASMEIPSSHSGIVKELHIAIGENISEGSIILSVEEVSDSASDEAKIKTETLKTNSRTKAEEKANVAKQENEAETTSKKEPENVSTVLATTKISHQDFVKAHASPTIRKFARELGVDLSKVSGKGRNARILKTDVQHFIKKSLSNPTSSSSMALGVEAMPEIDFSQWGDVNFVKLSKINKLTGKFLHRNWLTIPHVTQFDEADISELEAFRKQANTTYQDQGFKLTLLSFLLKAVVATLKKYPRFNSSLSSNGNQLIEKKYFHIGVAVATPDGLVVPVIRDVDQKNLSELALDLKELSQKAREKKLSPSEMQGGCFTISSLGGIGGTKFTPIVNAPEVAILGVSKASTQPVWDGSEFKPRLMCPISLSYDHRVIDGAEGAAFTTYLCSLLSDVRHLLI